MQNHVVMAFRKRLKSFGYLNVSICQKIVDGKIVPSVYIVRAIEPLGGNLITAEYSISKMNVTFR